MSRKCHLKMWFGEGATRKFLGVGVCGPQKKTIIKFEKLPDTKY